MSETWKTGCIFHLGGSSSFTLTGPSIFAILNGPSRLGENFLICPIVFRFLESNQTRSYSGDITDAFLSGRNIDAWKCCGDVHRLCSKHNFKRRHLRRLMYLYIVSEFCEW